jgi:hypothetical protein
MRWLTLLLMACGGSTVLRPVGDDIAGGGDPPKSPGGPVAVDGSCSSNSDCAAGTHCSGGELGTCTADGACENDPNNPNTVFPPKWPPLPPTVPESCRSGFEMNGPYEFIPEPSYEIFTRDTTAGSQDLTLELDLATYQAPDGLEIDAERTNGERYVLFDSCMLQTSDYPDPTDQQSRPPEDSIRDFRIHLKEGTVKLHFNFSRATTPMYIKVTGLCDFDITTPIYPDHPTSLQWLRSF